MAKCFCVLFYIYIYISASYWNISNDAFCRISWRKVLLTQFHLGFICDLLTSVFLTHEDSIQIHLTYEFIDGYFYFYCHRFSCQLLIYLDRWISWQDPELWYKWDLIQIDLSRSYHSKQSLSIHLHEIFHLLLKQPIMNKMKFPSNWHFSSYFLFPILQCSAEFKLSRCWFL